jgi:ribosomal protein L7Ae-like RNA K-turn-binding protein
MSEKVCSMIGLCMRAGQVISGESGCEAAVRGGGKVALVLLDGGAAPNLRKRFTDACAFHRVPLYTLEAGRLGQAIGKPERMVAAIQPGTMAQRLQTLLSLFEG